MENKCVCCNEIIPEGRQVCPNCERKEVIMRDTLMTLEDIKNKVVEQFSEGQEIYMKLNEDDRALNIKIKVKILKYYPNHVLTEHNGYKECFTYRDIYRKTRDFKSKDMVIPDKLKRGSYRRSFK